MKRSAVLIGIPVLILGGLWLFITRRIPTVSTTGNPPSATIAVPSVSQKGNECPSNLQSYQTTLYEICIPQNWKASFGEPPDPAHVAIGPQDKFRPLIMISVFDASAMSKSKVLLLADTVILERKIRQIVDLSAEQITFRSLQGATQEVLWFQKGALGFSILQMEGLEEENVPSVFEGVLASFKFRAGTGR